MVEELHWTIKLSESLRALENSIAELNARIGALGQEGSLIDRVGSPDYPDTLTERLVADIISSDLVKDILDSVRFKGITGEVLLNQNMESWPTETDLSVWGENNVLRSSDAYMGLYSAQLSSYKESSYDQKVATGNDDCSACSTSWSPAGTILSFAKSFDVAWRYFARHSLPIANSAKILSAKISLKSAATRPDAFTTHIRAIDSDNCPSFSYPSPWGYGTVGDVSWALGAWTVNVWYESPDISALVQAIVNRSGWVSGNYLGLRLDEGDAEYNEHKSVYAYDHTPDYSARLQVSYAEGLNKGYIDQLLIVEVKGEDFSDFSVYTKYASVTNPELTTNYLKITVYYTDETSDVFSDIAVTSSWAKVDIKSLISGAGHLSNYVEKVRFEQQLASDSTDKGTPILVDYVRSTTLAQEYGFAIYPYGIYTHDTTKERRQLACDDLGRLKVYF